MKKYFNLVLLGTALMCGTAVQAQEQVPATVNATASQTAVQVARVDDNDIATLKNLRRRGKLVVYLGASAAALQNDPAALQALKNWVGDGGVLAVYSDAATLFGFQLQTARQGTPQKGGQLFGRAVAALPFGGEPLLWPTPVAANDMSGTALAASSDPTAFGGMTVFYQMQQGDSLVVSHPSAIPLLRVTDLAEPQTALLASAMASYGNGWVIFVPRQIEATRTQGNQFLTNLISMSANPPLPVDISAITATANSLSGNSPDYKALLTQLQNRLAGKWQPATTETASSTTSSSVAALMPPTLPVARSLAQAMVSALQAADAPHAPARARKRADGEIALWMMQAKLQLAGANAATGSATATEAALNWLDAASPNAPNSREILFWKGVLQAQNAGDTALTLSQRASAFNNATSDWNAAATATPLLGAANFHIEADTANSASFGDIAPAMLALWARQAHLAATVIAAGPPIPGQSGNATILLHATDDPTLRVILSHVRKLPSLSTQFGWVAPDEDVLVFPNETALASYATHLNSLNDRASSLNSSFGGSGRIIGRHILIVAQQSEPLTLAATPRRSSIDTAILGRMHAEALMEALDEDGGKLPVWMQLGMMSLGSDAERGITKAPTPELLKAGAANQLLTANRFTAAMLDQNTASLADDEALSLMTYFYQRFGAGTVMETIQRIASGQSIAVALNATTGMSEDAFFKSWYTALAGNNVVRRPITPRPARRAVRRSKRPAITTRSIDRATVTRF